MSSSGPSGTPLFLAPLGLNRNRESTLATNNQYTTTTSIKTPKQ
jgi:hypothetical protein